MVFAFLLKSTLKLLVSIVTFWKSLAQSFPVNSFSFNRDAFLNMTRTGSTHQNFGYFHCSTTTKTNTSPHRFDDIEKLAKFCVLALLSEPSTATRDERITISVPATIHQSPTFRRIRGHWWTMRQSQQVPPGDACLYISSCPNIIGRCDISHFSMNAQPYTVVDCILRQGDCVFLMNQVDRAATHE
jgi:hypothetical protein